MAFDLGVKDGQVVKGGWPVIEQVKQVSEENRTIDFIFSDETLDRDHEIIRAQGWQLENYRKNPVFLFAHEHWSIPIGRSTQTWIADTKLMGRVQFAKAENGNEAGEAFFRLYVGGFLNCVSVGFMGIRIERPAHYDELLPSGARCEFVEQDLLECSSVTVPANPKAGMMRMGMEPGEADSIRQELTAMKAKGIVHEATLQVITDAYDRLERRKSLWFPVRQCRHEEPCEQVRQRGECAYHGDGKKNALTEIHEKKISGKRGLPLAETDRAWAASAARKRMAKWASSDGSGDKDKIDWKKFGSGHVVLREEDAPDNMGSYALPFADVIDGMLTAIPRGLFAAAAVLMGARGGVELTEADRKGAMALVKSYYSMMELMPPWGEEERGVYNLEAWERKELARIFLEQEWGWEHEPVASLLSDALSEGPYKSGQVLNSRNRRLITMMHECCHEMMANAGMEHPEEPMDEPEEPMMGEEAVEGAEEKGIDISEFLETGFIAESPEDEEEEILALIDEVLEEE